MLCVILMQSAFGDSMGVFGVKPNLILIFVICLGVLKGSVSGAKGGLAAGLTTDLLMGRYIGFYGLIFMYGGMAAGTVNRRFHKENYLPVIFASFLLSIAVESIIYLSIRINSNMDYVYVLGKYLLVEALYNMILSIFFYFIMNAVENRFSGQQATVKF